MPSASCTSGATAAAGPGSTEARRGCGSSGSRASASSRLSDDPVDPEERGRRSAVSFAVELAVALVQFALSFYGFWLVWRVLLPLLPGPAATDKRIAPYVGYFTDPFVVPLAGALHVPSRLVALLALIALAALSVALDRVPELIA
jgi:hypothetical protein